MNPNTEKSAPAPERQQRAAAPLVRACVQCAHYRLRAPAQLFSPVELGTPGGLKAFSEWQQQEKQHAERETQLVSARQPFTYEPHHYAWCEAFTHIGLVDKANAGDRASLAEVLRLGGATIHPVTGRISPVYALCLWKNERGDCQEYEPR